ncbi:MAG: hypothetical protein A2Y15_01110 [Clostridiales bacterium GWF2_36_10]|nr:MAG: hypothetical protein A2Y15_01110 [Clostridiales bacterium GWF2_36_10]
MKKIIIYIIIFLFIFNGVIIYSLQDRNQLKLNVVEINDITQTLVNQWEELDNNNLPKFQYGSDYVVVDNNGKLIKATRRGLNEDINSAISNKDTIVDIKSDNKVLGKLIIYNNTSELWQSYRNSLIIFTISIITLTAILSISYVIYIDKFIFRPFRMLQNFARHVAEGNLDIPLEMDKGNLFGAFTESFDLMRVELGKAREYERIANQSKKELVASLSHDIKTPVSSIKAVSEVLYTKSNNENEKNQLEIINAKADQINNLITNMFNATLEEMHELNVNATECSSEILLGLIKNADYNNQITMTKIPECIILADVLRLSQVIDNVVNNSYKYAGTSIDVVMQIKEDYLEVTFKDFGLGVSDDELPLLFNKYYRAKNSSGKSGAGLGLYISKYLMNKMSGDINCQKSDNGFIVILKIFIP